MKLKYKTLTDLHQIQEHVRPEYLILLVPRVAKKAGLNKLYVQTKKLSSVCLQLKDPNGWNYAKEEEEEVRRTRSATPTINLVGRIIESVLHQG